MEEFKLKYSRLPNTIPHICPFFYTTVIWEVKILHLKVRKFATKVASRQNSVNYHSGTQIMNELCEKVGGTLQYV